MDFDKQLLEIKKQKKREEFQSLETGFYINDLLVEFERISIEPILIHMMLPNTFVTMPQSMVKVKYPSENRPQLIKTSLDTTVNFTFNRLPNGVHRDHLEAAADQLQAVIKRTSPANVFFDKKKEKTEDDTPLCWFDYKGYAIDEQIYYMMYILPLKGDRLLHGTFNCKYQHMEEWKEAARQAILSICEILEEAR